VGARSVLDVRRQRKTSQTVETKRMLGDLELDCQAGNPTKKKGWTKKGTKTESI